MTPAPIDLPALGETIVFAVGWMAGWLGLARPRRLLKDEGAAAARDAGGPDRPRVTVVVPARDEAASLARTLPSLAASLAPGDELLVVDDGSTDATAQVAGDAGVRVEPAGPLPDGWRGKPHACAVGAARAGGEVLVFVDADTRVSVRALDALAVRVRRDPETLVSLQPRHEAGGLAEHAQLLPSLVSVMAAGAGLAGRASRPLVFGPVVAVDRGRYLAPGGHAHGAVRGAVAEDVALGRAWDGPVASFVARDGEASYRMYAAGAGARGARASLAAAWRGWTKNLAVGLGAAPALPTACAVAWVASIAGGLVTSPWLALANVVQVAWLARRVGAVPAWTALALPLHAAWFVALVARSAWLRATGGSVDWRGRAVRVR